MTERYEEVRRKLVARGYLQGPIERFLLRDLLAEGSPLRAVVLASLKAALLAAPLLGGVLAASTVVASRPLFGARDAIVLWVYFGTLAAAVLFALDTLAASIAAAWARHRGARPGDARTTGLLVAAPLLAYLVVLQAKARPEGSTAVAIVVLAASLLAAAFVAWLAGIVSLAGIVGRTGEVPDRHRRPVALAVAVLLPVALASFLIPAATPGAAARAPSAHAATPAKGRVLFVAIDGLDGALVEALGSRDVTEHLLSITAKGAVFPMHRAAGSEPAEVWTTIVTGMPPEEHGVRGAGATHLPGVATPLPLRAAPGALQALRLLLPGRTVPASGAGRRVRALWEIASFAAPSAAVNFWATWPARGIAGDASGGYVVSDRVLPKLLGNGSEDRDVRPEALFARLGTDFAAARPGWRREFDARFSGTSPEVQAVAWESSLIDGFSWDTARRLSDDPSLRSGFVYLPGLDILRLRLSGNARSGAAQAVMSARVLETYARWLDDVVFADVAARAAGWRIVVVADPGRSADASSEGFVAVVGGGAAAACVGPSIGDLDVAPLVLRLLGLPASSEMAGAAPSRCFEGAAAAPAPIATWGRRGLPAGPLTSDYDQEMVLRLRSLGYLR